MNVLFRNISGRCPAHLVLRLCLVLALPLLVSGAAAAPRVSVKASLDSATLLMGRTTRLHLQVEKMKDTPGHFPLLTNADPRPYATLLGDTIEVSKSYTTDTVDLAGGMSRISYHIPVQVFDSGSYRIPGFQYVSGNDTVVSNTLDLEVVPVDAKATDEISGLTDVAEPAPGTWLDDVPDWVLRYWWAILAGIALVVTAVFLILRLLRSKANTPKAKPAIPPYQEAVQALRSLHDRQLWQHGENETYFVELTGILRRYLSRRFGVAAPEMTTSQFLDEASRNPKLTAYGGELRRLLGLADFIKFAKGQSLPDENEEAFAIVRKFVEDTRPTPEEEAQARLAAKSDGQVLSSSRGKARSGHVKARKTRKSGKEARR